MTLLLVVGTAWVASPRRASAAGSFSLVLAPDNITASEVPDLDLFLARAEALLPPMLKQRLARTITVRFVSNLDSTTEFQIPPCGGESEGAEGGKGVLQVRGRIPLPWLTPESSLHEIDLNRVMIPEILKGISGSRTYACGHHNLYYLALATLLHEVSHLYDFSGYANPERQRQLDFCDEVESNRDGYSPDVVDHCENDILKYSRAISHLSSFKSLIHWGVWRSMNRLTSRSPDPYEYTKPEESFAVNMEYFLLDPDYACRRPGEFAYLRDQFDFDPHPGRKCKVNTELQLTSTAMGEKGRTINLDPARVYQIQYLYASGGDDISSRFGHAMFRIILCNPARKEVGPGCLNDLADQIVVSYRANQGGWNIDAWKGLFGGYPSQLFLYPFFPSIVNEYTLDQNRDLIGLPLKLSDDEKTRFIHRVIEDYWTYQGRYFFFTNNCATEVQTFLKAVLPDDAVQKLDDMTPSGLYEDLGRIGLTDPSLVRDRAKAEKEGYLYPSLHPTFEKTFNEVRGLAPDLVRYGNLDDYVSNSTPEGRMQLYRSMESRLGASARGLVNRFFVLETYIFRLKRTQFMQRLEDLLSNASGEQSDKLHEVMDLQQMDSPLSSPLSGYGIPTKTDLEATSRATADDGSHLARANQLLDDVMSWAKLKLSGLSAELDEIKQNRSTFLKDMIKK